MFFTYGKRLNIPSLSPIELKVKTTFFWYCQFKWKNSSLGYGCSQSILSCQKHWTRWNILFSAFEGSNAMSGKKNLLQKRIRNFSPFNIYINCCNHGLALCLPHLMKNIEYAEPLLDYDAVLLGMWKMFHYSPKKELYWNQFKVFMVKNLLKCWRRQ